MKITKEKLNKILLEESQRFQQSLNQEQQRATEEKKLATMLYTLLSHTRDKFEQYFGDFPEGEKPSDECQALFDEVEKMWGMADDILTGGSRAKALPKLFGSEAEKEFADTEEEEHRRSFGEEEDYR